MVFSIHVKDGGLESAAQRRLGRQGYSVSAWLGLKALGSGTLAREVMIRRPLVRKVLARERGAGQRNTGRNWNRAWSRGLGSETLGMKPAGFGGAGNYPRASLGLRQESGKSCLSK